MSQLIFFLEEESAKHMLQAIVPHLLPQGIEIRCYSFEGKQDLEKNLERRLRNWVQPDTRFIIMRDQDAGDCRAVKARLMELVRRAGKAEVCLVRIACHELESFYLGDLAAVEKAFPRCNAARLQEKSLYRDPDHALPNAAEQLKKMTRCGDVAYQKISGSRAIAPYLDLSGKNRSVSFNMLLSAIRRMGMELAASR